MDRRKQACREELAKLLKREANLEAALLCSVDGLPVAYATTVDLETDAIAAMCSSMLSLGDALAIQGGDDGCIQVITQSFGHTIALIHAGNDMLLVLMGNNNVKLGMLLGQARNEVEIIIKIMQDVPVEEQNSKVAKRASQQKATLLEELVKKSFTGSRESLIVRASEIIKHPTGAQDSCRIQGVETGA
ncbi:MAG: roadblock/LC7 domain-containing protein [Mariprofundus sp.]